MKEGLLLSAGDFLNYQLILPFHKMQPANEKVKKKKKDKQNLILIRNQGNAKQDYTLH